VIYSALILYSLVSFFIDTATTDIYTLSLHDALPIFPSPCAARADRRWRCRPACRWRPPRPPSRRCGCRGPGPSPRARRRARPARSEEHTSELQSRENLVCRLLLEKKKKTQNKTNNDI